MRAHGTEETDGEQPKLGIQNSGIYGVYQTIMKSGMKSGK